MSITYLDGGATLSADQRYRYLLWRRRSHGIGRLLFVMCNPSTADARDDDPTIRRCAGFAAREHYGVFSVVNLWAYRSTDPTGLRAVADPVGEDNDAFLRTAAGDHDRIVVAWGAQVRKIAGWKDRVNQVVDLLCDFGSGDLYCLGQCRHNGPPRHPLMVRADQPFDLYDPAVIA